MTRLRAMLVRKRVLIPLGLVGLYAALGYLLVPRVVHSQLEQRLPEALHRPASVGEVTFDPFALALTVSDLKVSEKDGAPFIAVSLLFVDASFLKLVRGRIGFDEIRIEGPRVAATLFANGDLSFADLLAPAATPPPAQKEPPSPPPVVSIARFELSRGAATFTDRTGAEPFTATLEPLALTLTDFTTEPNRDSPYAFSAKFGDATFTYAGDFSASPLRSKGHLAMTGIALPAFQRYVGELTQLSLESGTVSVESSYTLDGATAPLLFQLEDAKLTLDDLQVGGAGESAPVFSLQRLAASAPRIDVTGKAVHLASLTLSKGVVRARREKDGGVQLARLARPRRSAPPPPAVTPAPAAAPPTQSPWKATLARFSLEGWALEWHDVSLEYPVEARISALDLELQGVRWPLEGAIDTRLALKWMDSGALRIAGPVSPEPFAAKLGVELDAFDLSVFDGYAWASGFAGTVQHGRLGAKLEVTLTDSAKSVAATGEVRLDGLALLDSDDRPLLSLRSFELSGLDYRQGARSALVASKAKLAGVSFTFERDAKGLMNVAELTRDASPASAQPVKPAASEKPGPETAPPLTVKLDALELDDLGVDWLDRTTTPPFASALKKMTGKISNITFPFTRPLAISLAGRVDQAPMKVSGTLLPDVRRTVVDMQVGLSGYDLPRGTPYSRKYVAQPVDKGKLSLDVGVKLKNRKLDARTHFVVDQLAFGNLVEPIGPDATRLPLGLAVAVLTDRKGRIDLELPVLGDLDEPDFKWGGLVWKVVLNLMEKVATAPFTLLAGLFAGENPETLKSLAFAPGATEASAEESKKLDTLAKVLGDRPQLGLEIAPGADPVTDREMLSRRRLERSLTAHRAAGAEDAGTPVLAPGEYQRLVTAAWRKANRPAPDAGTVSFELMEAELLAQQKVPESDLDELKRDRAAWLQGALEQKGVGIERVFVIQGESAANDAASVNVHLR